MLFHDEPGKDRKFSKGLSYSCSVEKHISVPKLAVRYVNAVIVMKNSQTNCLAHCREMRTRQYRQNVLCTIPQDNVGKIYHQLNSSCVQFPEG